jgi:hypothetical protein
MSPAPGHAIRWRGRPFGSGRIRESRRGFRRVKLSPSLIERHPYRDETTQIRWGASLQVRLILRAAFGIFSREKPIVTVLHVMIDKADM